MADTTDERRHAEMKMRHERAHRMRQRLVKQQETEMNDDEWVRIAKRSRQVRNENLAGGNGMNKSSRGRRMTAAKNRNSERSYSRFLRETSDGAALYQAYRLAPKGTKPSPRAR